MHSFGLFYLADTGDVAQDVFYCHAFHAKREIFMVEIREKTKKNEANIVKDKTANRT